MRRRLLLVLLLFSAAAVAAFAVPLLSATANERTQRFVLSRTADLDRFAALAQQAEAGGDRAPLVDELTAYASLYGEPVVVVDARRRAVAQAGLSVDDPGVARALDAALRNQPAAQVPTVLPWSSERVLFARPVGTGTRVVGAVVLRASVDRAAADVAGRWSWVLGGALAAALGSVLLVLAVTRWLLRPLAELAEGVRAVAAGQRRAHVTGSSGPPEVRELSEQFNRMSDAVGEAADQQRRLIADASHQLRNPMAALRLRMDALSGRVTPEGVAAYTAGVAEIERLESMLDGLLALAVAESKATEAAAGGREPELADLAAVAADRADFWQVSPPPAPRLPVLVRCPESDLAQVLDVLLDNALKHGGAARVALGADRAAGTAWVEVADDGPGMGERELALATRRFWRGDSARPGTGLGLAIADQLVRARGGALELSSPGGLVARVVLPLEPPL
ncbi:sensor histidine kinase [Saccharothrix coeruleofusca]|uniref:histidine kinase n=1 Tax=Saccharothrix coeruleofusca TaxID=33919 RepID=A0A918APX5_9PSEU|nr:HAMP domain-containing sensor histidine kinase [Saccharothrix coeruleofusca]MBP2337059.1 signal transduction histidine kinase [Saccharothrix coeruleofusca]GGP67477.1 two-component sensor histidine kinase [Saccharothrix coeruleofusca]